MNAYVYTGCDHLRKALDPCWLREKIESAVKVLQNKEFDSIAISGLSGLTFGSILAFQLNKPLIVVRKPHDTTIHGARRIEGNQGSKKYLIVDDCISTGHTIKFITEQIYSKTKSVCTGVYTYEFDDFFSSEHISKYYNISRDAAGLPLPDLIDAESKSAGCL